MRNLRSKFGNYNRETFSSLYIRNYRLYFIGQIISTSGTWIQSIAQSWLVLQLTGSGTALGLITMLQSIPVLVLGPYGDLIADRVSKRKILTITQTVSGILALILGGLVATNLVKVWMVDILAFCLGLVNVFDNPTRQTIHIELVGPEKVRNAVTLFSILFNVARVIGPSIAGILIATVGLAPCFFINGISYAAVVIMLAMMRTSELHTTPPVPYAKGQIQEGFKYAISTPIIASTLLMMFILGALTFEFPVTLPLLAQTTFGGDASSYAFLTSAMGVGAAAGGLFFARRKGVSALKLVNAAVLLGLAVLASALMPNLLLTGLAMVFVGICTINFATIGNTTLQLESSPQMRGRVMSFWGMGFLGTTTVGGPIVGWFSETAGPRWGLALGGLAALAAAAVGALRLRSQKTTRPDAAG